MFPNAADWKDTRDRLGDRGWAAIDTAGELDLRLLVPFLRPQLASKLNLLAVDRLSPRRPGDARPGTMSARYGMGAFPLHTDRAHWPVPPRYVLLRSIGETSDRPTTLLDAGPIVSQPRFRERLRRGKWLIRSDRGAFLCAVLAEAMFRYDTCCMLPADEAAAQLGQDLARELASASLELFTWMPRRILILDNWRVLHGRGTATAEDFGRILERVVVP
jgi:hypothetical protein